MSTQEKFLETFGHAMRVSAPLVAIKTPDPAATVATLCANVIHKSKTPRQTAQWDVVRGFSKTPLGGSLPAQLSVQPTDLNPVGMLNMLLQGDNGDSLVPSYSVIFMHLADRLFNDPSQGHLVTQAIWNLRDSFKTNWRMLVLLVSSDRLPPELKNDVIFLDEPLPDAEHLGKIVDDITASAKKGSKAFECDGESREKAVIRLAGLSAFAAQQATSMSARFNKYDLEDLWSRKIKQIEQTPGLSVDKGGQTFDAIGGLSQAVKFGRMIFEGDEPPALVVRVEEIEKVMAGAGGDMSGTSQDALQVVLNAIQDYRWTGLVAFGPPGSGKSEYSKSMAATFGTMSLALDLNACKGSLVGQSEQQVREAIKTIYAVGGNRVFLVATCNKLDTIPPELQARFGCGIWMFDAPTPNEQQAIWKIKLAQYGLSPKAKQPTDNKLVGRDIDNCCRMAKRLKKSPADAFEFINPLHLSNPKAIAKARETAVGKFLAASYPGPYQEPAAAEGSRAIEV